MEREGWVHSTRQRSPCCDGSRKKDTKKKHLAARWSVVSNQLHLCIVCREVTIDTGSIPECEIYVTYSRLS